MIGPHQGKELELMLRGEKRLAVFSDVIPESGDISEEIIPEAAFAPYVEKGMIRRFCCEKIYSKSPHVIRRVCFTLPGHEWRADALLWMVDECMAGRRPFDDAHEYCVGRLLDYSETDIEHFIRHAKAFKKIPA